MNSGEQELLKVMKMNKDDSSSLLKETKIYNEEWERRNEENAVFLKSLESKLGVDISQIPVEKHKYEKREVPTEISWDEIVGEARQRYVSDVYFEDILSSEQIQAAYKRIEEYNKEFEDLTKLNSRDVRILFIAVALQCVRQYVLDPFLRERRSKASSNDEKGTKGNATPGWYYVPTERILVNRVPFDAQDYNRNNPTIKGFLKGAKDHRFVTLGHDPILGWLFGTANILTSTITRYDFVSAHVKLNPNPPKRNYIHSLADNSKILEAIIDRFNDENDGKLAIAMAVLKEAKHLLSDVNTEDSLPIPFFMQISPQIAEKLAKYGVDTASVCTAASGAFTINTLIAMIHGLSFGVEVDDLNKEFYQVRTRKILLYSNVITSTSNIIATYITGNKKILDVGGFLITIGRLFSDVRFITRIKQEFVETKLMNNYKGTMNEMQEIWAERYGV